MAGGRCELRGELYNSFNFPNFRFAGPGPQNSIHAMVDGSSNFGYVTAAQDKAYPDLELSFTTR